MKVVGNSVDVNLGGAAFLCPNTPGEITEMIDAERQVGGRRFPDRFAVVQRFSQGNRIQVLLNPIGNPVHQPWTEQPRRWIDP